ncbi:type II secretion system minor pseudopilin GspI [Idiomarina sp.]|uniref:type II secretion system minor pseudopilin GspI n=1 Tax=Idiomarina sp. TaxID=1874361 RepID=UPI0025C0EAF2|nr:type II secretion system minor pseudopilin GspI [Idiomarina sp.]MEC7643941.1 type II secretion system minor pseudopilin GspI [Pseudomonadota bacterium]MEC9319491.1 type II secretion system minor pseudopilin GspI [Pseudomonadota bacterium]NQZ03429.1 type II secretion system minor pseudopilin GspI [Idiomarina sp.]
MKRNNRGFTLIEVMVAIAIFAMAALAAVSAASGHLNSLSTIQQRTFAQYVAANRLTDLNLANTWPIKDNQRGSERQGGVEWQWRQQVVETVTPNVVAVTIEVTQGEQDYQWARLTQYIRKPQSSDTDGGNNAL